MTEVTLKRLTSAAFASYGDVFLISDGQKADSAGEGWQCWYPLGRTGTEKNMLLGIVRSEPKPAAIHLMERHQDRVEYLIALDRPIIQAVALNAPEDARYPDQSRAEAFIIYPGEIAMVNRGVWHSAAMALGSETTQYLFLLGSPGTENGDPDSGLTPFIAGGSVQIIVPPEMR